MHRPSEKPTSHHPTRALIGLVLLTLGCATTDKTIKPASDDTAEKAVEASHGVPEEPCTDKLKEVMGLCVDMCRMRSIGAIGEFDKSTCDKQCEDGTSKYPKSLRGLFDKCGDRLKKNEITPKKDKVSPKRKHRQRRRRRGRVA